MTRRSGRSVFAFGLIGVVVVLAALWPFNERVDLSVPALLLLLPIVAASVFGGWRAAVPLAVLAALGYSLGYVPPVGDVRPHVGRDAVTLVTFVAVGLIVGLLAHRGGAAAAGEARQLDARRVELMRSVGHDLRNPLHTIQTVTNGLISSAPDEIARASLATVAAESQRLDRIVANMLSASRIEAGALLPERSPEHVGSLVEAAIRRLAPAIRERIDVDVPDALPEVSVDVVQFDQVLTNVIENAVRHGAAGGPISVRARGDGRFVEVCVDDDGPGFDPVALAGVDPFHPGAPGGEGLGLSVCRGILAAHGGRLELANKPGGGARVGAWWPLVE